MIVVATRFAFSLVATAALTCAQQSEAPVQSLLRPAAHESADTVVTRAFAMVSWSEDYRPWHSLDGEFALMHVLSEWVPEDCEPHGIFTEDSLTTALSALGNLDASSIRLVDSGSSVLLQSDIPERVAVALDAVRRSLPPRIEATVTVERLTEDGPVVLLRGQREFRNGETATITDLERRRVLRDFDVEIAQASATAAPIVSEVRLGASIALRARPLPLRDQALIEAVVRIAAPLAADPIELHPGIGPVDRISDEIAECGTSFRVARGVPSIHEWTAHDGSQIRLTLIADWTVGPTPPGNDVQVICTSLWGSPVLGFPFVRWISEDEPLEATSIASMVESRLGDDSDGVLLYESGGEVGGGCLIVEGNTGRSTAEDVAEAIDRVLAPVQLEIDVLDVPRGTAIANDGSVPPGARSVAKLAGPAIAEHSTSFGGLHESTYAARYYVEVAQSARIPDPWIDVLEDGYFVSARPLVGTSGRIESLRLSLEILDVVELTPRRVPINSAMTALASVTDDSRAPAMWLPQDVIVLEQPIVRSSQVTTELSLDQAGQAIHRSAATALFGENRDLVVRVTAR